MRGTGLSCRGRGGSRLLGWAPSQEERKHHGCPSITGLLNRPAETTGDCPGPRLAPVGGVLHPGFERVGSDVESDEPQLTFRSITAKAAMNAVKQGSHRPGQPHIGVTRGGQYPLYERSRPVADANHAPLGIPMQCLLDRLRRRQEFAVRLRTEQFWCRSNTS